MCIFTCNQCDEGKIHGPYKAETQKNLFCSSLALDADTRPDTHNGLCVQKEPQLPPTTRKVRGAFTEKGGI